MKPRLGIPVQQTGDGAANSDDDESGDETEATEDEARSKRKSQATKLVALARQGDTDLFHDEAGKPYITFPNGTHQETWSLTSTPLRDWLSARYYATYNTAPGSQALKDALNTLSGIARFKGERRPSTSVLPATRATSISTSATQAWEVVQITAAGWEVIAAADAPIRFRRPAGLLPLPPRSAAVALSAFRNLINVKDEAGLHPHHRPGCWARCGPMGHTRSSVWPGSRARRRQRSRRMLRSLIDPNTLLLRAEPKDEGDLLIAAQQRSGGRLRQPLPSVPNWLSDALCRLASGGGLVKRKLYTDAEEVLLDAQRPVLLTGIEAVLTRGDAIDRRRLVELAKIADTERRTEEEIEAEFEKIRPGVLGVSLNAASTALRQLGDNEAGSSCRAWRISPDGWRRVRRPSGGSPNHFLDGLYRGIARRPTDRPRTLPVGPAVKTFMEKRSSGKASRRHCWPLSRSGR